MSVMIETIGSRNLRWLQRKRDDFLARHPYKHIKISKRTLSSSRNNSNDNGAMPQNIMENGRFQHAISSLSSSSGSTSDETRDLVAKKLEPEKKKELSSAEGTSKMSTSTMEKAEAKKVSSSSSSNDTRKFAAAPEKNNANDYHDYNAPSLPDPLLDSDGSSPESDLPHNGDSDHCVVAKNMCTDSSSGDDAKNEMVSNEKEGSKNDISGNDKPDSNQAAARDGVKADGMSRPFTKLPPNIAKSGGIPHNVTALPTAASLPNGHAQLSRAPITALPPFAGLGKKTPIPLQYQTTTQHSTNRNPNNDGRQNSGPSFHSSNEHANSNIITIDNDTSSQSSSQNHRGIQAYYHINEDDMCMTDDVLMCPFTFRSLDAVWCGALAECVMPGMLRVCFSPDNKLKSVEMIFDAMGFCQQLEHASGDKGMAQIIPHCLEMVRMIDCVGLYDCLDKYFNKFFLIKSQALVPNSEEARVITLAKAPYAIVSVNEAWTKVTGYTQLDVEGKDLSILQGERTNPNAGQRSGYPVHDFASVSRGISACSVNINYDKENREFLNFVCSYPLTNVNAEITHLLHVCQELPQ